MSNVCIYNTLTLAFLKAVIALVAPRPPFIYFIRQYNYLLKILQHTWFEGLGKWGSHQERGALSSKSFITYWNSTVGHILSSNM